ncbi:macro domain-containing protein [Candidatus Bathyarchaeota archaeon]|nr:MAG: macro domain-containing protein [Candidatus Bathyarchaeota archaeon]RLG96628.1 MAG: O-acetyl-ADP-ribose deacetylase [Candidatus Bathyarchaeota archaeon]HDJ04521.1 macro domain-containing protein [Candidatus Bathyarchaeota archaeon]
MTALKVRVKDTLIELVKGDITDLNVECIVNAANSHLRLGGGVAGAIRRRGGPSIQKECNEIIAKRGRVPVGEAVITGGGNLKARYVIHAVGPVHGEGDEDNKLRRATVNSLKLADEHKIRSIAFPAISTGYFGLPKDRCARNMLNATLEYVRKGTGIEHIIFCLYDEETYRIFEETLKEIT